MDPEISKYYDQCTFSYPRIYQNLRSYEDWFIGTEPPQIEGALPTHGRAMSTPKLKMIMYGFVSRLAIDAVRNARYAWEVGTPLPSRNAFQQPLADFMVDDEPIQN